MSASDPLTIPDLSQARRILAIQPHYDDNDIAAGGTLAALAAGGAEVIYLTATDDLVGVLDQSLTDEQMAAQLRREQEEAGKVVGVGAQYWLGYPDAGDYSYFDLRRDVIKHIRLLRPDFIFTCDPWLPYEAHNDHIQTGRAAAEAMILYHFPRLTTEPEIDEAFEPYRIGGIVFYATAHPNTIYDISATREAKHQALDYYQAQFSPEGLTALHELLDAQERRWAEGKGFSHGEPLKALQIEHLHIYPDAWKS